MRHERARLGCRKFLDALTESREAQKGERMNTEIPDVTDKRFVPYRDVLIICRDLAEEVKAITYNKACELEIEVRKMQALVRQFNDTTLLVGALADRIADRVAAKLLEAKESTTVSE